MSSSRSLASARTKRAAGNITVPGNTPEQGVSGHPIVPSTNQMPHPVAKLSLPQAINRISERLNNLDLFAETTSGVINDIQEFHSNTSDKYIVDTEVFTSIVSRLDALERTSQSKLESKESIQSSSNTTIALTNDIDEIRKHLIRLQTYVMDTNAKLQDLVFNKNGESLVNFGDIFSDSLPNPLMQTTTIPTSDINIESALNEDNAGQDTSVIGTHSTIQTFDDNLESPN